MTGETWEEIDAIWQAVSRLSKQLERLEGEREKAVSELKAAREAALQVERTGGERGRQQRSPEDFL